MPNGWFGLETPDGWSAIGEQTRSAWGPHCAVGSSSAGSAVAISAGFSPASIGVESCGSIVSALYEEGCRVWPDIAEGGPGGAGRSLRPETLLRLIGNVGDNANQASALFANEAEISPDAGQPSF